MPWTTKSPGSVGLSATSVPLLLFIYADQERPVVVPLMKRSYFTLGRDPSCDVIISHDSVSRRHATLKVEPLAILDGGSRNGIIVRGARISSQTLVPLTLGETFQVGSVPCRITEGVGADDRPSPTVAHSSSSPMDAVDDRITTIAKSRLSVLLVGETGVGKDVLARRLHERSPRAGQPLLALNCAALPEGILDGELFGHEKGAFTGANEAKPGLFEAAHQGTIFLDEVGEMPLGTQAKLLRTLENGEVLRLGARKATRVDVRVLAATHRDLEEMVQRGTFRQDLFYRLNGVTVDVPPLRQRQAEILPLAESFLHDSNPTQQLSADARAALLRHAWPGNIRELRNVVERASVLTPGRVIDAGALGLPSAPSVNNVPAAGSTDLTESVAEFEKRRVLEALAQANGVQKKAAELLGISTRQLNYRLELYKISSSRKSR